MGAEGNCGRFAGAIFAALAIVAGAAFTAATVRAADPTFTGRRADALATRVAGLVGAARPTGGSADWIGAAFSPAALGLAAIFDAVALDTSFAITAARSALAATAIAAAATSVTLGDADIVRISWPTVETIRSQRADIVQRAGSTVVAFSVTGVHAGLGAKFLRLPATCEGLHGKLALAVHALVYEVARTEEVAAFDVSRRRLAEAVAGDIAIRRRCVSGVRVTARIGLDAAIGRAVVVTAAGQRESKCDCGEEREPAQASPRLVRRDAVKSHGKS